MDGAYSQLENLVHEVVEVAQFSHLNIPEAAIDDPMVIPIVGRIPDSIMCLIRIRY